MGGREVARGADRSLPNVNGRPALSKPTRDALAKDKDIDQGRGRQPNVNSLTNSSPSSQLVERPTRNQNVQPKRGSDPEVLKQFKPGRLDNQVPNVNSSAGWDKLKNPEVVKGPRDRDVKGGKAPPRQRVESQRHGNHHDDRIFKSHSSSSCGHSFCGGHGKCVYGYDYHDPVHGGWCDDDDNWSVAFSFGTSGFWGVGVGVGYGSWYGSSWGYSGWCAPVYYSSPYYCRPYYSARYAYGCYAPWYSCYTSYYPYRPASSYWWLYDSGGSYDVGYDSGYVSGFEAGRELAYDNYGGYEPTWLDSAATGASHAGEAGYGPYTGSDQIITDQDGWDLLAGGDAREARRAFDRETMLVPGDGLPQIGYAITAGLMERYEESVAAMRKALREDPDAFAEVPGHSGIIDAMRGLLAHYRNATRERPDDVDGLFMSAALRHLLGEDALAYFAADKAIEAGDSDLSALVLKDLIQRSLDAQLNDSSKSPAVFDSPLSSPPAAIDPPSSSPSLSEPRQF